MRREQAEQAVWLFVKSGRDLTSPNGDHITPGPSPGGCGGVSTPQTMQPGLGPSYCGTHTTWRAVTRTYTSLLRWLGNWCDHTIGDSGKFCLSDFIYICTQMQISPQATGVSPTECVLLHCPRHTDKQTREYPPLDSLSKSLCVDLEPRTLNSK